MSNQQQEPRITTALIPAAGTGKRLHPYTRNRPKCLVDVNGKTLLAYAIDALETHGFERLIIITGHRNRQVAAFVDQYNSSLEIQTIYNDR